MPQLGEFRTLTPEERVDVVIGMFDNNHVSRVAIFGSLARSDGYPGDLDVILTMKQRRVAMYFLGKILGFKPDLYMDAREMRLELVRKMFNIPPFTDELSLVRFGIDRKSCRKIMRGESSVSMFELMDQRTDLDIFVFPEGWEYDEYFQYHMRHSSISEDPNFLDNILRDIIYIT